MTGKAGLKAGLIGAGVLFLFALADLIPIPFLGCVCCGLDLLVYIGVGVLAGFFLTAPRTTGGGAGAGAIGGLLGGLGAGIGQTLTAVIGQVTGLTTMQTQQLMEMLVDMNLIDPGMIPPSQAAGWGSVLSSSAVCCPGWLAIGAGMGAIGGAIFAAVKPEG